MTTIVTGGLGFIGAHTARAFAAAGERVVATSYEGHRVPSFLARHIGSNLKIERCDVGEPGAVEALARKHGADGIVHLAIHRLASADPGEDLRTNMDKLSRMLDGAIAAGVRRVCWASNGAIFAELQEGPFHEETPVGLTGGVKPGAFKKAWEVLAHNYANNYGAETEVVSMRISGVFGPTYRSMLNLPSRLCHAASHGHGPDFSERFGGVPFAGDTFDLTYASDVGEAIRSLQLAPSLAHRVYNIGRGETVTAAELVDAVRAAKPGFDAELQEGRSARYRPNACLTNERITGETGWRPANTIPAAIADYIAWLDSGEEF
ncbi:MAG: NAD(P)-dependent oxidoreductase [Chloroflexi bacterium]|nr:NAD(P)-dependent oxidoreductase [Chloroflexota bacterium]